MKNSLEKAVTQLSIDLTQIAEMLEVAGSNPALFFFFRNIYIRYNEDKTKGDV